VAPVSLLTLATTASLVIAAYLVLYSQQDKTVVMVENMELYIRDNDGGGIWIPQNGLTQVDMNITNNGNTARWVYFTWTSNAPWDSIVIKENTNLVEEDMSWGFDLYVGANTQENYVLQFGGGNNPTGSTSVTFYLFDNEERKPAGANPGDWK